MGQPPRQQKPRRRPGEDARCLEGERATHRGGTAGSRWCRWLSAPGLGGRRSTCPANLCARRMKSEPMALRGLLGFTPKRQTLTFPHSLTTDPCVLSASPASGLGAVPGWRRNRHSPALQELPVQPEGRHRPSTSPRTQRCMTRPHGEAEGRLFKRAPTKGRWDALAPPLSLLSWGASARGWGNYAGTSHGT